MFKFMKTKKGFTLVELMIVVVIMAILVAVAVPIYSAVTKNARAKTCASNRREILSQFTNYCMGNNDGDGMFNEDDTVIITTDKETGVVTGGTHISKEAVEAMFQDVPYCPVDGNTIEVVLTAGVSVPDITVTCKGADEAHGA